MTTELPSRVARHSGLREPTRGVINCKTRLGGRPAEPKENPPGGVIRAGHFDRRRGSGGGSADRGLWNFGAMLGGLSCIRRRNGPKGSTGPPKINPPGGVIRAGHFDRCTGSEGVSADRG